MFRPVNARVRGRMIAKVVFTLDGRHFETVRSPDSDGRFGVTVDRRVALARQAHAAREGRVRPGGEAPPELLRLAFRRCPERATPKAVQAGPAAKCGARPVPRLGARSAHPARARSGSTASRLGSVSVG